MRKKTRHKAVITIPYTHNKPKRSQMNLSKSQYIKALQCHKALWLQKNNPELKDATDEKTESLFKQGDCVGELAKELFPDGKEIVFNSSNFSSMVDKTKALIADGVEIIYEVTFREKGIFAMADILVKNGDAWDIYEVKSSTSVKGYHLDDASIQWYAFCEVLKLNRAYIVHINNNYVRDGELDIDALFTIADITDIVKERQYTIKPNLEMIEEILEDTLPSIDIGVHCNNPHVCDFYGHCWSHVPPSSVFNLYRMSGAKKFEMYYKGILHYHDIPSQMRLSPTQTLQLSTTKTKKPHIDRVIIDNFLETISYPINFFDFETFQNAIPRFDGQRPYIQMPFQYSLHILHEDGRLEHKEFLGNENSDPRDALIKQMLQDITAHGSIVAYNKGFEIGVIRKLAEFRPEFSDALLALNERFVDLIVPFRRRGYYHPDFNGSFSLKSVLPALFPNDAELDYKKLEIQDGGMAMDTFANLHLLKDKSQREKIREDLLVYCKLDTLAMVRILQMLNTTV